jgi:hypothetical protein
MMDRVSGELRFEGRVAAPDNPDFAKLVEIAGRHGANIPA